MELHKLGTNTFFAVDPLYCKHVDKNVSKVEIVGCKFFVLDNSNFSSVQGPCVDCGDTSENWLCLQCSKLFCSRYVKSHFMKHAENRGHKIGVSLSDLSFWCYECDSYVIHDTLDGIYSNMLELKFPGKGDQIDKLFSRLSNGMYFQFLLKRKETSQKMLEDDTKFETKMSKQFQNNGGVEVSRYESEESSELRFSRDDGYQEVDNLNLNSDTNSFNSISSKEEIATSRKKANYYDENEKDIPKLLSYEYGENKKPLNYEYGDNKYEENKSSDSEKAYEKILSYGYTDDVPSNSNPSVKNVKEFSPVIPTGRDWNKEFQQILENTETEAERSKGIYNLCEEFSKEASKIAMVIVTEKELPLNKKKIVPVDIGGVAGGTKYIVNGIIFKFAVDDKKHLYPSTEYAMKAANAELRALISLVSCKVKGLSFPLMVLVDYRGYRLIATAILPISRNTLRFGSSDAGITVHDKSPILRAKLTEVANYYHLKTHPVGSFQTPVCIDLEGHVGYDERLYVIDTARLFPPTLPNSNGFRSQHLFNFFRPEYMKKYCIATPISSDALSFFGKATKETDKEDVKQATEYLIKTVIPNFALELDSEHSNTSFSLTVSELTKYMKKIVFDAHRSGINFRFLGLIRTYLKNKNARDIMFVILLWRTIKNDFREKLRYITSPDDHIVKKTCSSYFNQLLGKPDNKGKSIWSEMVKPKLLEKYPEEIVTEFSLNFMENVDLVSLILLVTSYTGVKLDIDILKAAVEKPTVLISDDDINKIEPTVKPMSFVLLDEATSLMRLALRKKGSDESKELLVKAMSLFKLCLEIKPDDEVALTNWAKSILQYSSVSENHEIDDLLSTANTKLKEALTIKPGYPEAIEYWGKMMLQRANRIKTPREHNLALSLALEALDSAFWSNPQNFECLLTIGKALLSYAASFEIVSKLPVEKAKEKELKSMKKAMMLSKSLFSRASHSLVSSLASSEQISELSIEKFKLANFYKPKHPELLTQWGIALLSVAKARKAKGVRKGVRKIIKEGESKFSEALDIDPNYLEAMEHWYQATLQFSEYEKDTNLSKLRKMLYTSIQDLIEIPLIIEVGNLHQKIPNSKLPHEWTAYLRSQQPLPLQSVEFHLHPTFSPSSVKFTSPPYHFMRKGWGTFRIIIKVTLEKMIGSKVVELSHDLSFKAGGGRTFFEVDLKRGTAKVLR